MTKEINHTLDIAKSFACIGVIMLHCPFPGKIGMALYALSKFSVPFFFMISGYYCINPERPVNRHDIIRKIKHILIIAIEAVVIYCFFHILLYCILGGSTIQNEIQSIVSLKSISLFFLVNSPMRYSHLWFLFALLYCYCFILLLADKSKKLYSSLGLFTVIGCAILFVCICEIYPITTAKTDINILQIQNFFLLRAFPFFALGMLMRKVDVKTIDSRKIWLFALMGGAISVMERFCFGPLQFYIGTYPLATCVYLLCIKYQSIFRSRFLEYIGAFLSLYVYVFHIAIRDVLNLLFDNHNIPFRGYLVPLLVIVLSMMASWIYVSGKKFIGDKKHGTQQ